MPELKESLYPTINLAKAGLADSELRRWHRRFQADPDVINLSLGEPAFGVSQDIKNTIHRAIEKDASNYATTQGDEALRVEVARYMEREFQAPKYTVDEVLVTIGATEGIYVTLQALFSPGDQIIVPTPAYPLYKQIAKLLKLEVITIDTSETDFRLTTSHLVETLTQYPDVKGFIFNDPTNPTGVVYEEKEISALAQILAQTDILVVTDEIYGALTYEAPHVTMAKYLPNQTVIIGGLSKSHAMPGYRLGFVLGPKELIRLLTQTHQVVVGSVPPALMAAGLTGLVNQTNVMSQKDSYQDQRDIMIAGLQAAGLTVIVPEGAFYVLAKVPREVSDTKFVIALVEQAKVGVLPGKIFDAPGYIRLSFACSLDNLTEALNRIKTFMTI